MKRASPPPALIRPTVSSPASGSMSATTTLAPSAANRSAIAAPMPRAAPVTTATLACNRMTSSLPGVADIPQRVGDLLEDRRTVAGRRHRRILATGDLLHGAAQDLARAGLRQAVHPGPAPEGGEDPKNVGGGK